MYRRRRPFGRGTRPSAKPAIKEVERTCIYKNQKCCGCGARIALGEQALRLQLAKRYRVPCTTCGREPSKSKWFHLACRPADVNKSMGYNPTQVPPPYTPTASATQVPPPPKPKSSNDMALEALAALESSLILKVRESGQKPSTEMEKAFKTFNGIKARVLRPGTPAEGETAMTVALKRIIDMVFAGK